MPTKKPSAKQLAARAKFVKMVRAKAAKSKLAKNKLVGKIVKKKTVKKAAKKKTIKQTGTSNKVYDKKIQALKPGKRISKKGNKYTENRKNRSDKGKLLGIVKPKPTIISLAKKIQKLTDINDHNKAVLTLAKFLKNKNSIAVINNIIKMHNSYGFMPNALISLRKDILQNLFTMFKNKFGEIDYKLIYSSF